MGTAEDLLRKGWRFIPEQHDDGSGAYFVVKIAKDIGAGEILMYGRGASIEAALTDVAQKVARYEQDVQSS